MGRASPVRDIGTGIPASALTGNGFSTGSGYNSRRNSISSKDIRDMEKLWQTETELIALPEVEETVYQNCLGRNRVQSENFHLQYQNKRLNITHYHHQAMP